MGAATSLSEAIAGCEETSDCFKFFKDCDGWYTYCAGSVIQRSSCATLYSKGNVIFDVDFIATLKNYLLNQLHSRIPTP